MPDSKETRKEMIDETPLIVIPGARKSGTTTLYQMLLQHEAIRGFPHPDGTTLKEPLFFAMERDAVQEHLDWYTSLFDASAATYHVDACQHYFVSPETPDLLDEFVEEAKIIIVLRDPVERIHSDYLNIRAAVDPSEKRRFQDIVDCVEAHREAGIDAAENECIQRGIRNGRVQSGGEDPQRVPFPVRLQDSRVKYQYIQNSLYSRHIERFRESRHDVLVVCFEQLIAEPDDMIEQIFDFLDMDGDGIGLPHQNKSKVPSTAGRWYLRLTQLVRRFGPLERLLDSGLADAAWVEAVKDLVRPSPKSRSEVEEQTSEEVFGRIRALLSDEYQHWQKHRPAFTQHWTYPK
jgi:hypothetical protein